MSGFPSAGIVRSRASRNPPMPADGERSQSAGECHRLGSYEVVRKLATGGMGEVYLAHQTGPVGFRREVVLKTLHRHHMKDPQFVAMFLNEAKIAASLAHPNIIHTYELFEDDGYVIAMEYVRGATVLSLIGALHDAGHDALPYGPMVRIATSVCEALHYAYNELDGDGGPRRVIHRDISPSNVIVGYDGQVKLVDFGIAKVLGARGDTQTATIKGKGGYLAPEQIRCQPLDQRSDLFSLGTLMWEMSVGRRLFQRDSDVQMMYAILEDRLPLPSEYVPDYPKDLEYVVMKALARVRDDRYASAGALAHDLGIVAQRHGWDQERSPLAELVTDLVPNEHAAFVRSGSPPTACSFAPKLESEPARATPWLATGTLVTVSVLLALSAVFWLWIAPAIGV